ncbi:MAG TPA: thioredoxin domain-containing protein [Acholeplasma sp.]|nr:thioredoxin domain-containing protein [Acholeplasma sp.]
MLFELDKVSFQNLVLDESIHVLVEFFAPWCRGCDSYETILEDISDEYFGKLKVYKLNVEDNSEIADAYDVFSLPTLRLFKDGKVINELDGLQSENSLKKWLKL